MKIVYVVNNFPFFISHRLEIARSARMRGDEILVVGGAKKLDNTLEDLRSIFESFDIDFKVIRNSNSLWGLSIELVGFIQLIFAIYKFKPNIVHCISPRANLLGGLASILAGINSIIFSISGMGYIFTDRNKNCFKNNAIRYLYIFIFKIILKRCHSKILVQNRDDELLLRNYSAETRAEVRYIKGGSGIFLEQYSLLEFEKKENIILFPARILADKGIREFIYAAHELAEHYKGWRFVVAGAADYGNPSAIGEVELQSWVDNGVIEYVGHINNISDFMKLCKIVCLPSYREGMPKALLEAAASGCAVVTSNAPGCREAIIDGVTGTLVPCYSVLKLVFALSDLMSNTEKCKQYGKNGRAMAIENFSSKAVINQNLKAYDDLYRDIYGT